MTNEQSEGLPTAAIVSFAGEETHEFEAYGSDKTDLTYRDDVEKGDELVRRRDVEALIQEKIEHVESYPVDEEIAVEQSKILQELLDEVQNQ